MSRNRLWPLALIVSIAAGYLAVSTLAHADESATGKVQIVRVEYNVRGIDTPANAYLESVQVKNLGADQDMTNWTLEDSTGHAFTFPAGYVLKANQAVNVRTGVKPATLTGWWANPLTNLYWNRSHHMYGNSADSVTLENAGTRVDRVAWNDFTILP